MSLVPGHNMLNLLIFADENFSKICRHTPSFIVLVSCQYYKQDSCDIFVMWLEEGKDLLFKMC